MQAMGMAAIHAVPLVEVARDPRQRLLLGWARITLRVVDRPHLASVAVDDYATFGRQHLAQMRELDLAAEVDGIARAAADESAQRSAEDVVALKSGVLEAHHLGQKGVHADESIKPVP